VEIRRFRPSIYGILCERGKVLVTETRGVTGGASFIQFPGGGIKRGEEPGLALQREFVEETGLAVRADHILYASMAFHRSWVKPDRQLLGIYWRVSRVSGELTRQGNGDDVLRVFWCSVADLLDLPFTSFDREALPTLVSHLKSRGTRRA
jgi:8-oxo-dGTP diphosphatase